MKHTNPITQQFSIARLISILNLPKKRIIHLLNNDHIRLEYGELVIDVLRGENTYSLIKNSTAAKVIEQEVFVDEDIAIITQDKGKITIEINDAVYNCVNTAQIVKHIKAHKIPSHNIEFYGVSELRIEKLLNAIE